MNLTRTADEMTPPTWLTVWRPRLLLALWAAVALAYVAVFVLDLWLSYGLLAAPCAGPDCHYQAIGTAEAAVMESWGLSTSIYALYMLGSSVLPLAVFTGLAAIMLARLYPQPRGFLYAITMVVIPVITIASFDVVTTAFPILTRPLQFMVALGHFLLMSFFLVFPRSRFEPGWSAVLPALIALLGVYFAFFADQFTLPVPQSYTLLLVVVAAVIVYRYRRVFDATERRQAKWVVFGVLVLFAGVPIWSYVFEIASPAAGQTKLLMFVAGWTVLMAIILVLPATIFIAIFRYQLWDIDLIISRTLVYGVLTAGIIAVYALIVGGIGSLLATQDSFLLSLFAAGIIAVLFQPVREGLQRWVNRLLFGQRDDPYAVLSSLSRTLQETAVPNQTLATIATTITHALKLPYAAVEVETAEGTLRTVAADGQRPVHLELWPLRYQGQVIGQLAVASRAPGEAFTRRERDLLTDIASQAGAAAFAVRLTDALQRSREKLVLAREEERRRIRRDLHDELGPALASQTFKLDAAIELLGRDQHAASSLLADLKSRNQALVGDIRRLVYELRPPALDELGLRDALSAHFGQAAAPAVIVTAAPDPLPTLPAAVEVAAYRIALEAVNNVLRHARADTCAVNLLVEDTRLTLTVTDDGVGLPAAPARGIGLRSMRDRAEEVGGTLQLENAPGGGARVTARLPLAA